ncbi:MAG: hypothetical protein ACJAQ6_001303 [Arenicella sp.]|jgi:hypothetical protein
MFADAYASETEIENNQSGYVAAKLKQESKRWGASYPGKALSANRSGAVELLYVVDTSGRAAEIVVGSHTNEMFIKQSIKALKKYRYTPALRDGKPVDSFMKNVFTFTGRYLNSKLVNQFDKNYQLFDQEFLKPKPKLELLKKHLKRMNGVRQANPSMQGVLNYVEMIYAEKYLPLDNQIETAYVADIYSLGGLSIQKKLEVKRKLISSLVAAGRYAEAADIIKSLKVQQFAPMVMQGKEAQFEAVIASVGYLNEYKASITHLKKSVDLENGPFAQTINEIEEIKRAGKPFASTFTISGSGYILRGLLHDRFTIDEVKGEINELVFRCKTKFYRMKFSLNQDYQVPKSWGECNLQVNGVAGTQAKLIEG